MTRGMVSVLIMAAACVVSYAQTPRIAWYYYHLLHGYGNGRDIAVDLLGNIYIATSDCKSVMYNPNGTINWISYAPECELLNALTLDKTIIGEANSIYVTGRLKGRFPLHFRIS